MGTNLCPAGGASMLVFLIGCLNDMGTQSGVVRMQKTIALATVVMGKQFESITN